MHPDTRPWLDYVDPDWRADHPAVAAWQAHVSAGRIGNTAPISPAEREKIARLEILFRAMRTRAFP